MYTITNPSNNNAVMIGKHLFHPGTTTHLDDYLIDPLDISGIVNLAKTGRLKVVHEYGTDNGLEGIPVHGIASIRSSLNGTPILVKTTPTRVTGWSLFNRSTEVRYLHLYDANVLPTGQDAPALTIGIPSGQSINQSMNGDLNFCTGLVYAISPLHNSYLIKTLPTDAGADPTSDVVGGVFYA